MSQWNWAIQRVKCKELFTFLNREPVDNATVFCKAKPDCASQESRSRTRKVRVKKFITH